MKKEHEVTYRISYEELKKQFGIKGTITWVSAWNSFDKEISIKVRE